MHSSVFFLFGFLAASVEMHTSFYLKASPMPPAPFLLFTQRLRVHQVPYGTVYVPNMAPGLASVLAADLVPDLLPDLLSFGYQLMYAI